VPAERVEGWLERFAARHGTTSWEVVDDAVELTADDGSWARLLPPFPPLAPADGKTGAAAPYGGIVGHVLTDRRVGVLLVRLGGHAAGVFEGSRLVTSKVGSRQVHGRSAAGGWSQQRFARRRGNQADELVRGVAEHAVRLLPATAGVQGLVVGGDRTLARDVLADPRLAHLDGLPRRELYDLSDPRLAVLQEAVRRARAVWVDLDEPDVAG